MKRMLDTNAYVAFKRGDERILKLIQTSESLLLPLVVIGELMFGFHDGHRFERNLRELDELLENPRVSIPLFSLTTTDRF